MGMGHRCHARNPADALAVGRYRDCSRKAGPGALSAMLGHLAAPYGALRSRFGGKRLVNN